MHPGIPTYFFYILHMYVYFQSHLHFLLRLAHPHCKSLCGISIYEFVHLLPANKSKFHDHEMTLHRMDTDAMLPPVPQIFDIVQVKI